MLRLNNVEVVYDRAILVLKGISLDVPEQRIITLLGSNGAGKSTTLKAISGLLKPERGEITDRKSTRLNSSHGYISYAAFCLKKKKELLLLGRRTEAFAV